MEYSRESAKKIARALQLLKDGEKKKNICELLKVSRTTLYRWSKRYSGISFEQIVDLWYLEKQNRAMRRKIEERRLCCSMLRMFLNSKHDSEQ
ncbi:helix-turn-helix domain-containing protein [Serratia marcescens]|uniref:helix-turn-helix domain-containing protein n=1 Tax=Serratia marcescens TaxID=615 RepID=UPI003FA7B7ED